MEKGKPDAYEPGCPNEPSTNRIKRIRRVNTALSKLEKENELTEGAVLGGRKTRCVRAMLSEPSTNRRKRIRRINTAIAPGDEKRKEKKRRKKTTTRPDTKIGTK